MPALPPKRPGCTTTRRARPLPDPAAVRLCLIPDPAPPFDGETPQAGPAGTGGPGETAAAAGRGAPPRAGRDAAAAEPGEAEQRRPGEPGDGWPSRFAQVLAETLGGARHPRQLAPWTTVQARDHIQRLGPQLSSAQQPRVRRVVTFSPTSDAMEMSVVVGFGSRVRALAVRLEREQPQPGPAGLASAPPRWLCTAVEAA
ncbi:MAG TPA: Rv3235 family protein [Streptosporangiaceae bacterium]|jgi:hypothetical protein